MSAVAWPGQEGLALALAERADGAAGFPGIGALPDRPIRLILAPTRAIYDSLTRGRLPHWSEGAAFPDAGTVVLLAAASSGRLAVSLRHELAHLALRWHVRHRLPLWFEEGYAAMAAREWDRLDALRLNWQLARGVRMNLDDVDRALRGARGDAATGYALATTAVVLLDRWGGPRGLGPLLANLPQAPTFDAAIRATYYLTADDFEARWQADVRSRYGWVALVGALGTFWLALAALLAALVALRRRRDRARREQLLDDVGIAP
ncbi:MAG: peptidase MA family metallohydrolase [Gemmatimonadales bacterium]